jgi:hypothetical protein
MRMDFGSQGYPEAYVAQPESGRHVVTLVLGADHLPALSHTTFPNIVARASHRTSARRE